MNPDYDGCQELKAERESRDLYAIRHREACGKCGHSKTYNGICDTYIGSPFIDSYCRCHCVFPSEKGEQK